MIAMQKILSSCAEHACSVGVMPATHCHVLRTACLLFRVDINPLCFFIMCPFNVSVDRGRCLLIKSHVRQGNELNPLGWFLIATRNIDLGGGLIAWWWYMASSALELVCVTLPT